MCIKVVKCIISSYSNCVHIEVWLRTLAWISRGGEKAGKHGTCLLSQGPSSFCLSAQNRVTLAKVPVLAVSVVFVWSRGILDAWNIPRIFENGNEASRLFILKFQELRAYAFMLGRLPLLPYKICRSVARSVHLLCNAIVNSSWLPHDHVRHVIVA